MRQSLNILERVFIVFSIALALASVSVAAGSIFELDGRMLIRSVLTK